MNGCLGPPCMLGRRGAAGPRGMAFALVSGAPPKPPPPLPPGRLKRGPCGRGPRQPDMTGKGWCARRAPKQAGQLTPEGGATAALPDEGRGRERRGLAVRKVPFRLRTVNLLTQTPRSAVTCCLCPLHRWLRWQGTSRSGKEWGAPSSQQQACDKSSCHPYLNACVHVCGSERVLNR